MSYSIRRRRSRASLGFANQTGQNRRENNTTFGHWRLQRRPNANGRYTPHQNLLCSLLLTNNIVKGVVRSLQRDVWLEMAPRRGESREFMARAHRLFSELEHSGIARPLAFCVHPNTLVWSCFVDTLDKFIGLPVPDNSLVVRLCCVLKKRNENSLFDNMY